MFEFYDDKLYLPKRKIHIKQLMKILEHFIHQNYRYIMFNKSELKKSMKKLMDEMDMRKLKYVEIFHDSQCCNFFSDEELHIFLRFHFSDIPEPHNIREVNLEYESEFDTSIASVQPL